MRLIFLGTNGWYDAHGSHTFCLLLQTPDADIIVDAGSGLYRCDRYVDGTRPVFLFFTHFHFDHIFGLHALGKFRFQKGLRVTGPAGTRRVLDTVAAEPFTIPWPKLPYSVEISDWDGPPQGALFHVTALPLQHTVPCLGYRFECDGRSVAVCTDTGPCESAVALARGADVLVAECSLLSGQSDAGWGHLNPELAAALARDAGARTLILTHFDASLYTERGHREAAAQAASRLFPGARAAYDNMMVDVV